MRDGWCELLKDGDLVCEMPLEAARAMISSVQDERRNELAVFAIRHPDGEVVAALDLSPWHRPRALTREWFDNVIAEWILQSRAPEGHDP